VSGEWRDPGCNKRGYTLRRDGKSAEVIERKADMGRPLRKRVRKSLKAKGLNKRGGEARVGEEVGAGVWQTQERMAESTLRVNYFLSIIRTGR
jgi:hypothetical protein